MADASKTLNKVGTIVSLSPSGSVSLAKDETLTISIGTGLPTGTEIKRVQFFAEANHVKTGNPIATWKRTGNSTVPAGVGAATNGTGVKLTDDKASTAEIDYYYNVTAKDPAGNPYSADPELILKKRTGTQARSMSAPRPISPDA